MTDVSIIGASGYTGGELLRLLLEHPGANVVSATSSKYDRRPLHQLHPNLRGATDLRFVGHDQAEDADVVFTCTPHGASIPHIQRARETGQRVIDLSADLRLDRAEDYERWYGREHPAPELLQERVYGLPEANREALRGASLISGVGCLATAMNLALMPLRNWLSDADVIVDAKIGSSAAGVEATPATAHPVRSRSLRLYAPTGHRHAAEVAMISGIEPRISAHSVELVRGILATCHVLVEDTPDEKELFRAYRSQYEDEPFVRRVRERQGLHRGPDPKVVLGSNFADVGFHVEGGRIVATSAIDNLVKGAAGTAVQCMNLSLGLPEATGLQRLPVFPQ